MLTLAIDSFQEFHDGPAPPPPAPASGPALLDDREAGMLDDFFEKINTGQLENNAFLLDDAGQVKNNPNWNPWALDDLPPLFHGSSSSLAPLDTQVGPQLQKSNLDYLQDFGQLPAYNSGRPQSSNTSPDVLAAASTLLQNTQNTQNGYNGVQSSTAATRHNGHIPSQSFPRPYTNPLGNAFAQLPMGSLLPPTRDQRASIPHPRQMDPSVMSGETVLRDIYFGGSAPSNPRPVSRSKLPDLRWGSDASFFEGGFVPPPNQETEEEITGALMSRMEGFEPQTSANTTQPSSPMMNRPRRRIGEQDALDSITHRLESSRNQAPRKHSSVDETDSRPRKRQKSKLKSEYDDDDDDDAEAEVDEKDDSDDNESHFGPGRPWTITKGPFYRSSKVNPTKDTSAKDDPTKDTSIKGTPIKNTPTRRRSSPDRRNRGPSTSGPSGDDKPKPKTGGRDNLTDAQKRSNHILSEQKRRNLIKQGFEELGDLVPELRPGGFSKSAMLTQAALWLEGLIRGNEKLKGMVEDLKEQQGS